MPRSLRARVTTVGVLTLALVLGVGAWVTVRSLAAALRSDTNAQNEEVLDALAAAIADGADPATLLLPVASDGTDFVIVDKNMELINASQSTFAVADVFGEILDEAPLIFESDADAAAFFEANTSIEVAVGGPDDFVDADQWFETTRIVDSPNDGELTLIAFTPFGVVGRSITRLSVVLAIIVPLLVLLGGGALWMAIGAALRPVQRISDEAKAIAPSTSGARLPVPESGDEVADLTVTLNGMLDRLDAGLIRQRQFVSDASHELRSPLTAVKGSAELLGASRDLPPSLVSNVEVLKRGTGRLEAVLDDLTQLAEGGTGLVRTEVDLDDLILAEVSAVAASTSDIEFDTSAVMPAVAHAHGVQLSRAVHNLVANAARFADSKVAIGATVAGETVEISVDDDGPGIADADRERVFERFVRLDDGRSRAGGGSGLGLALVASIADAHGGTVHCTESPLGGARFVLRY